MKCSNSVRFIGVVLVFRSYAEQFIYLIVTCRSYCWLLFIGLCAAVRAAVRPIFSRKAVAADIAKIITQFIFTSKISSNGMMVGSSLPMAFVTPV